MFKVISRHTVLAAIILSLNVTTFVLPESMPPGTYEIGECEKPVYETEYGALIAIQRLFDIMHPTVVIKHRTPSGEESIWGARGFHPDANSSEVDKHWIGVAIYLAAEKGMFSSLLDVANWVLGKLGWTTIPQWIINHIDSIIALKFAPDWLDGRVEDETRNPGDECWFTEHYYEFGDPAFQEFYSRWINPPYFDYHLLYFNSQHWAYWVLWGNHYPGRLGIGI